MVCQIGDVVAVRSTLGTEHLGVYVGPRGLYGEDVLHNDKSSCVRLACFADFSQGRLVRILHRVTNPFEREIVARRGLQIVGMPYDLIRFNCEHAAYYALTGQPRSPQLDGFAIGLAFIATVFFIGSLIES